MEVQVKNDFLLSEFDACVAQAREKVSMLNKPVKVDIKMFIGKHDRIPKIQCKIEELVLSHDMYRKADEE